LLVIVLVFAVALIIALVARKLKRPTHPMLSVGDVGDRPGVVLFTSTDCSNCREAIALLKTSGIPFREVTHDLEPQRFETWDVLAVPLTVVIDADSRIVEMMSGVPRRRRLARAVRAAGIERS
jgi:glutaredoxin